LGATICLRAASGAFARVFRVAVIRARDQLMPFDGDLAARFLASARAAGGIAADTAHAAPWGYLLRGRLIQRVLAPAKQVDVGSGPEGLGQL
jgi:hypothetical protein